MDKSIVDIKVRTPDDFLYVLPAEGRKYKESNEFISREERSANGKLRRDITAAKKTFILSYDPIEGDGLDLLDRMLAKAAGTEVTLEVTRINVTMGGTFIEAYTVLAQPYGRERLIVRGLGLWGGVSLQFVEV